MRAMSSQCSRPKKSSQSLFLSAVIGSDRHNSYSCNVHKPIVDSIPPQILLGYHRFLNAFGSVNSRAIYDSTGIWHDLLRRIPHTGSFSVGIRGLDNVKGPPACFVVASGGVLGCGLLRGVSHFCSRRQKLPPTQ